MLPNLLIKVQNYSCCDLVRGEGAVESGFAPAAEVLFILAKGPKTMLTVVWPSGFLSLLTVTGGAQTRYAQTLLAFFPVAVARLGQATRPGSLIFKNSSLCYLATE